MTLPPNEPQLLDVRGAEGLRLAVADHGGAPDGPTVVLIHGYPDDRHVWDLVVPDLTEQHRVVTYDVRGAGASEIPASTAGYRMEHLVDDLASVIDAVAPDAATPGRGVHVVAHDWGSIQAWSAMTDPVVSRRIAGFTSMSGPSLDHVARWMRAHRRPGGGRWRRLTAQGLHSWYIYAFHTPFAPLAWRRGLARRWPALLAHREGVAVDDTWPGPGLTDDAVAGIGLYRANMLRHLRRSGDVHTDVPVQLVIARRDAFVSPALLDGIEEIAPDLVRVEVDAPHWLPRARPELVARLVAEHVARVAARRTTAVGG